MRIFVILALIISIIAIIFALQNIEQTEVALFNYSIEAPLAIIIFGTLVSGFIIGVLFMTPSVYRNKLEKRKLSKKIKDTENISKPKSEEMNSNLK